MNFKWFKEMKPGPKMALISGGMVLITGVCVVLVTLIICAAWTGNFDALIGLLQRFNPR